MENKAEGVKPVFLEVAACYQFLCPPGNQTLLSELPREAALVSNHLPQTHPAPSSKILLYDLDTGGPAPAFPSASPKPATPVLVLMPSGPQPEAACHPECLRELPGGMRVSVGFMPDVRLPLRWHRLADLGGGFAAPVSLAQPMLASRELSPGETRLLSS